jgi:predicted DNA-binding transcriptional regulator YafY
MPRTRALVRQWTLLRVLSQHVDGLSIEDMARQTAVNARTIRRDLKLFVEAGIPLRETVSVRNKKTWRIDQHGTKVLANHSTDECLALLVAELVFQPLNGTHFYHSLSRCRERVTATMSPTVRKKIDERAKALGVEWTSDRPLALGAIESLWDILTSGGPATLKWPGHGAAQRRPAGARHIP